MPGPRGEVEEDDGVLLGMVFDGERMRTSLVVRSHACPASALGKQCIPVEAVYLCIYTPAAWPGGAVYIRGTMHSQACVRLRVVRRRIFMLHSSTIQPATNTHGSS